MYLYRSNHTLIQTSFQMATKRNIRSVVEDPENIFRFGKFDPLTSNTPKQIAVSIPMGGLKLKWLTQGWRFVEVDLSNDEGQKKGIAGHSNVHFRQHEQTEHGHPQGRRD
jgi:hypothetical protein